MATIGTTIFSHILPVIFGLIAVILIIAGSLEESKVKLAIGIILFMSTCIFPYIALSILI